MYSAVSPSRQAERRETGALGNIFCGTHLLTSRDPLRCRHRPGGGVLVFLAVNSSGSSRCCASSEMQEPLTSSAILLSFSFGSEIATSTVSLKSEGPLCSL